MDVVTQSIRLVPFVGDEANANAYLALTALGGVLGWGVTALVVYGITDQPRLLGLGLVVTVLWAGLFLGRLVLGFLSVESGAQLSTPNLVWVAVIVLAFVGSIVGLWLQSAAFVLAPWYGAFAVGYLATAALVSRAGVYWVAGIASLAGLVAAVLAPGKVHVVALGVLHVVPLAVDAAMGGRQMTDRGVPAVDAERMEEPEETGGVITS